jgi:hypothetical protein
MQKYLCGSRAKRIWFQSCQTTYLYDNIIKYNRTFAECNVDLTLLQSNQKTELIRTGTSAVVLIMISRYLSFNAGAIQAVTTSG